MSADKNKELIKWQLKQCTGVKVVNVNVINGPDCVTEKGVVVHSGFGCDGCPYDYEVNDYE